MIMNFSSNYSIKLKEDRKWSCFGGLCGRVIVQIIFYFWSFEIMEYILRTRKLSYAKIHFLNKFEIFWYFSTYQSLRLPPLLKSANSQYFPLAAFARFIGSLMRL